MQISAIQVYPVKGMSASALGNARLEADSTMAGDRVYAIRHEMPAGADALESPNETLRYLTLSRNPKLGELQSRYAPESSLLELNRHGKSVASGHLHDASERRNIEDFLVEHMGDSIRGELHIVEETGADFSYMGHAKWISLINLKSIAALEKIVGRTIDPSRFRANVYFQGREAWEEFDWIGREIRLGDGARCIVKERIERCAAVNIDPASGAKDMSLVRALFENFGHRDLGVYAHVVESGDIAPGQEMEVLPQT